MCTVLTILVFGWIFIPPIVQVARMTPGERDRFILFPHGFAGEMEGKRVVCKDCHALISKEDWNKELGFIHFSCGRTLKVNKDRSTVEKKPCGRKENANVR